LVVEADGDINIDSGGVFYDATNNRLAIGTTSPSTLLHVNTGSDATAITVAASVATGGQLLIGTGAKVAGQQSIVSSGNGLDIGTLSGVPITFFTDGTANERARIDANGRLLVGTSSALTGNNTVYARLQVVGNSAASPAGGLIAIGRNEAATSITAGETLGTLVWGDSGAGEYAWITCEADANAGSGDYPGRLVFSTTNDGASSPTEAFRMTNDKLIYAIGIYGNTTAVGANVTALSTNQILRSTSSGKYKTEVEDVEDIYSDAILQCRPVWYRSICKADCPDHSYWGFIAEEVAEIDPRLVHWKTCESQYDESGSVVSVPCEPEPEGVAYDRFVPHLLNLIKRQKEQIEAMEARLSALEAA
jgi:hypothetical protein